MRRLLGVSLALVLLQLASCSAFKRCAYEDFGNRDGWQQPERVVEALELVPGARVADLGAGGGYFTFRLADAVGPDGVVYAVDVDEDMLDHLTRSAAERGYANVKAVRAAFDDPRLPDAGIDLVFSANTYHHLEDRPAYFARLRADLAPGGRVAILDYDRPGLLRGHFTEKQTILAEMQQAGYALLADHAGGAPPGRAPPPPGGRAATGWGRIGLRNPARGDSMAQLGLFEGPHLPRTAAREALWRGDLEAAHAQLERLAGSSEEAADAARLARIASARRWPGSDPAAALHAAFAAGLTDAGPRGFLSDAEWLVLYAQHLAGALAPQPGRRFRGWLGAHFAFVAGKAGAARRAAARIVESEPPGPAWIEAARLAFQLGEDPMARAWIHTACLESPVELSAEAPSLEACGVAALDAAPPLPALPAPVEDLFDAARELEDLPGPWTRWIAVIGEIDRVLAPSGEIASDEDPAGAFLSALRAARRSRERDRSRGPGRCSDRELRTRRRMERLAPALLARYLRSLDGSLF
jgi:arsenite methyltransferase